MQQVKGNDDSREVVICEGVVGFKSDFPGGELPYRTRGDLAIAGFQDLIHKYDADEEESDSSSARESSTISPKDEVKLKKELINRLSSSLLPTLRQSVIKVSISPDPADLPREPGEKLKQVIEGQSELDHTWDQIQHAVRKLYQDSSSQANDKHLKDFKRFRLHGLSSLFEVSILEDILTFFNYTLETIQRRGLSNYDQPAMWNNNFCAYQDKHAFTNQRHTDYTASVLETIDSMVECLKGSEFDIVQRDWPRKTRSIDDDMKELLHLINPTVSSGKAGGYPACTIPRTQPAIRVAQSLLTIIKMSRMFFNKLSKRGMNGKRLPLFTKMSSYELEALSRIPDDIVGDLRAMISCWKRGDDVIIQLPQAARRLQRRFQSALALIVLHFIPLVPDTDNFPARKKYFKTWFTITWSTHLDLAVSQLINSTRILHPNSS
ncbi:hypothetical protein MJO28_004150 [Puccinia striiformis f. sp. tritici]|uniref:Uncharacterized protein n=3 Tax=Puccinia striiformis TaxID=27350 RepID=A0A0L0VQ14_9BASI|nr:hypothetical protein Pst134EA_007249 [Puccinia striiformis f. sp. tritici]KAI9617090.1 hypothetical protein H4Q26_010728 [Puccinia striiformis f. sp. tritici PST-130]KNF01085.1 hypothetical protein PSTG_05714 [Puccinia striiformis f. sp. tritici PST-78]POW20730.1 hypothetical protein PSHT_03143 [Puccinia striiformis]KAH9460201.1 hypothetical protein Pst134EB_008388 [Puccinia striiformis f. sp. tritici]KAH9469979.1 hypothetical protein Pst134EA_007249 [Puccinia striiformis f. sp. tritici]